MTDRKRESESERDRERETGEERDTEKNLIFINYFH